VRRVEAADLERRHGDRGREQQIVRLEQGPHAVAVRELLAARLDVLGDAVAQAVLDRRDQPRVHARAKLGQIPGVIAGFVSIPQ